MTNLDRYQQFLKLHKEIRQLQYIEWLLWWDTQVYMPPGGAQERVEQIGFLAKLMHERRTAQRYIDLLQTLRESKELNVDQQVIVREAWKDVERASKVPQDLVEAVARAESEAHEQWLLARKENDFTPASLALKKMLPLKREQVRCLYPKHEVYDGFLELYEPDMTAAELDTFFTHFIPRVRKLFGKITSKTDFSRPSPFRGIIPQESQRSICQKVISFMGFDMERGRLDETVHPFCNNIGFSDVRLTTRYDERDFSLSFFSTIHEAGHGLYDQGYEAQYAYTPLADFCSMAIHESQSLIWEKRIGRSREFWRTFFPLLKTLSGSSLSGVSEDDFYLYMNRVEPSFIRIQADEVTYPLHVYMRYVMERELVADTLSVEDLPSRWNGLYQEYLGITPPDFLQGVLQDTHWYSGHFGYFPTYTLGASFASELYKAFRQTGVAWPSEGQALESRHALGLRDWLRKSIHRHGKRFGAEELLTQAIGRSPTPESYISYLENKYEELYQL